MTFATRSTHKCDDMSVLLTVWSDFNCVSLDQTWTDMFLQCLMKASTNHTAELKCKEISLALSQSNCHVISKHCTHIWHNIIYFFCKLIICRKINHILDSNDCLFILKVPVHIISCQQTILSPERDQQWTTLSLEPWCDCLYHTVAMMYITHTWSRAGWVSVVSVSACVSPVGHPTHFSQWHFAKPQGSKSWKWERCLRS